MGEAVVEICVDEVAILPQVCHQNSIRDDDQTITVDGDHSTEYASCRLTWTQYNSQSTEEEENSNVIITPDDWLPLTASRNGNSWTSAFHLLCSGIGIQALSLPVALVFLGWFWGILCLSVAFVWQLYTIGLLVSLHEATPGSRYSRYLHLAVAAFGVKLGKLLCLFPVMYLSGGTCVMFIITGGGTMKLFYQLMCGDNCSSNPLSGAEWYLAFTCLAIVVALFFSNLNSVAGVSLIGAITAVGFCTIIWIVSISKGMPEGTIHDTKKSAASEIGRIRGVLNALGFIALAFRGHNVVLEIQGTMPSNLKHPSSQPMWRGVATSYLLIATCFFPVTIVGYWTYGNMIMENGGGMLKAFSTVHRHNTPKLVLGTLYVLIVITCVTAYQIYSMVVFDNLERVYVSKKNKKCPKHIRLGLRVFFGGVTFFLSVAFPFLPSLAPLIGGITLPLTFAYPCFMWIAIKKPRVKSTVWCLNMGLGCLGIGLSLLLSAAAVWNLDCRGLDANFFNPH